MLYVLTGAVLGVIYLIGFLSCALLLNADFTLTLMAQALGTAWGMAFSITLFVALLASRADATPDPASPRE